nr:MAG TPA: hypothetical protein [Caudoviricetes sp.]
MQHCGLKSSPLASGSWRLSRCLTVCRAHGTMGQLGTSASRACRSRR